MDNNIVTLRDFIKIAPDLIEPWCCYVRLDYENEYWRNDRKILISKFKKTSELDPYLDYEIVSFDQGFSYGELDEQAIILREIRKE